MQPSCTQGLNHQCRRIKGLEPGSSGLEPLRFSDFPVLTQECPNLPLETFDLHLLEKVVFPVVLDHFVELSLVLLGNSLQFLGHFLLLDLDLFLFSDRVDQEERADRFYSGLLDLGSFFLHLSVVLILGHTILGELLPKLGLPRLDLGLEHHRGEIEIVGLDQAFEQDRLLAVVFLLGLGHF